MKALLDTNAFIWAMAEVEKLSPRARETIADTRNTLFLSAASAWEIAIKSQIGKLKLAADPIRFIEHLLSVSAIQGLPVQLSHALHVCTLPLHHRDPFDRILVAQGQLEKLPVITSDPLIARYDIEIIW